MPFQFGGPELIILLVVILIVFGVGRLPEVGGALGRGIKEFRKAQHEIQEEITPPKEEQPESKT